MKCQHCKQYFMPPSHCVCEATRRFRPEARMTQADIDWLEELVTMFVNRIIVQPTQVSRDDDGDGEYYWGFVI